MYCVVKERISSETEGGYETYSLKTPGGIIHDVTTEQVPFRRFVERLNRLGASEIHIMDLVEDFLLSL